jgi:hypothetical protein
MKKTLRAAILLGFSITASGQTVMGFGITDCGEMLTHDREDYDGGWKRLYTSWIQGHLSGLNQTHYRNKIDVMADLSSDAIYFSVLNVCRDNPTYRVWEAILDWRRTQ